MRLSFLCLLFLGSSSIAQPTKETILTVDDVQDWRQQLTIVVGIATAIVLVGLAGFFFIRSNKTTVAALHKAREAEKEAQVRITQLLESERKSQERIDKLEELLQVGGVPLGKLGGYQLLEQLGQGGMGVVYKGRHTMLNRMVALKVLSAERMKDSQAVARFRREMRTVGMLDHPSIVRAMDAGEAEGSHFLAMELVDGVDLAQLTDRYGPLPLPDACEIIREAAVALQHAHEHGLIHRDLKPSNLMLTPAGQVKILDLGLARLYGDNAFSQELTATGQVMGTPDYMAPEQAFNPQSVDIRADVYSLGCTLYKLLTGKAPFSGPAYVNVMEKLQAHAQAPVPAIRDSRPEVSQELAAVLNVLLAKKPADRFHSLSAVAIALEPFAVGNDLPKLLSLKNPEQVGKTQSVGSESALPALGSVGQDTKDY
jgi:serine/threonine protein kinase